MNGHHRQGEPDPTPAATTGHFFSFSIPSFLQGSASSSSSSTAPRAPPIASIDEFRKWLGKEEGGGATTGVDRQHRAELEAALGIASELRQVFRA